MIYLDFSHTKMQEGKSHYNVFHITRRLEELFLQLFPEGEPYQEQSVPNSKSDQHFNNY
jgi:hypothetical protein